MNFQNIDSRQQFPNNIRYPRRGGEGWGVVGDAGYLGRSELPEGLKTLFRPITVMVPTPPHPTPPRRFQKSDIMAFPFNSNYCWEIVVGKVCQVVLMIEMLFVRNEDLICHQISHHGSWTTFDWTDLNYVSMRVFPKFIFSDVQFSCWLIPNKWVFFEIWLGHVAIQNRKMFYGGRGQQLKT